MNKQMSDRPLDVAIAGAGIAGAALGAALSQTLGGGFRVAVFDPSLSKEPTRDDRVVAIAGGARRLFEAIGVWERLREIQPIRAMEITDSKLHDAVRQTFLEFEEDEEGEPFAHMVENRALIVALREVAEEAEVTLVPSGIETYSANESVAQFSAGGKEYRARLLVAADGAQSKLRTLAKIQTIARGYDQSGIVATVGHAREHDGKAVQHFLPSGSFAILPLTGKRSSIVWTEESAEAKRAASKRISGRT
jgi:2-octaprenyl-6-methoxyphenol hydroxylase